MRGISKIPLSSNSDKNSIIKAIIELQNTLLGLNIYYGPNTPLNEVPAPVGSIYLRSDGSSTTTLYVKESGSNTSKGWVAK